CYWFYLRRSRLRCFVFQKKKRFKSNLNTIKKSDTLSKASDFHFLFPLRGLGGLLLDFSQVFHFFVCQETGNILEMFFHSFVSKLENFSSQTIQEISIV
ncbi:MAG TPA: hypothetical protein PLB11_14615, partial [Flavobacterium sp.]|nr:hypothetical protein [Flavobacterium sp.]